MTNADIKEFKQFVKEVLISKYELTEMEAHLAIKRYYLTTALMKEHHYVGHDSVDEWAGFIYDEWRDKQVLTM